MSVERTRLTLRVLELMDASWTAHVAGDEVEVGRLLDMACEVDVDVVQVVRGGIMLGQVPNPEDDYEGWCDYVQAVRDRLHGEEGRRAAGG